MAEMVMALFAFAPAMMSAGTGAAAVSGGAAALSGGAAVAGGLGATSGVLSSLQGLTTAGSVLSSGMGVVGSLTGGRQQRELADGVARQEAMESERRVNSIMSETMQKQAGARVAFAASGMDISSGTPAAIDASLGAQADYEIGLERRTGAIKRKLATMRGEAAETKGQFEAAGYGIKGMQTLANFGIDIAKRG